MAKKKMAPEGNREPLTKNVNDDGSTDIASWEQLPLESTPAQRRQKARVFSALGYPDSLSDDWVERLEATHISIAISPLHNLDVMPSTGERKKPHYHVALAFDGQKTLGQVEGYLDGTGLVRVRVEPVLTGIIRYLIHADNKCDASDGRHRYSADDIVTLGAMDVEPHLAAKHSERAKVLFEMRNWCRENGVTQFGDFMDYVDAERPDWRYLLSQAGAQSQMEQFLRVRWRERNAADYVDARTELQSLADQVAALREEMNELRG